MQTFNEWLEARDPEFYLEAKKGLGLWGSLGTAGLGAAAMKGVMGAASMFAPTDTSQLPQVPAGYESQPAVVQQADQEYQTTKRAWAPHRERMQQNRSDLERKHDIMKQHGVKNAKFIGGRIVDPEKGPDAEQQAIIKMGRELGVR